VPWAADDVSFSHKTYRTKTNRERELERHRLSHSPRKALSTLSQKSATVAENDEKTATVAEIGDSVFRRQCGQALCRLLISLLLMHLLSCSTWSDGLPFWKRWPQEKDKEEEKRKRTRWV